MTKPTLIVTVGLPRSGKSTHARTLGCPVVNPDSIRLALHGQRYLEQAEPFVWAIAKTMVRALFLAGHEKVCVDATNTTHTRRVYWLEPEWDTEWHVLTAPREVCLGRAVEACDRDILPVIERMALEWEPVTEPGEVRLIN